MEKLVSRHFARGSSRIKRPNHWDMRFIGPEKGALISTRRLMSGYVARLRLTTPRRRGSRQKSSCDVNRARRAEVTARTLALLPELKQIIRVRRAKADADRKKTLAAGESLFFWRCERRPTATECCGFPACCDNARSKGPALSSRCTHGRARTRARP